MFSKPTNSHHRGTAPARSSSSGATAINSPLLAKSSVAGPRAASSFVGQDLVFEGSIHGEGELTINGAIKGDVRVAHLVIGETAHVEGTVHCGTVEVRGRVIGNIEAKSIKLYETSFVEGDITHGQLSIDVGAYFQGRCQQIRPEPTVEPVALVVEADAEG